MDEWLLKVDDLGFSYNHNKPDVLHHISFELPEKMRVGLLGDNGSGKSTLLRLLVGLLTPVTGTISLNGKVIEGNGFSQLRRRLGYVFQNSDDQLFSPIVREDVEFGPLNLGCNRAQAREVAMTTMAQLGISHLAEQVTYTLSGGEKRLVALAGVLAMNPEFLLLDEPFTGLDKKGRQRLQKILLEINKGMLVVSHDHEYLEKLTDDSLVLEDGTVI